MNKRILSTVIAILTTVTTFTGCSGNNSSIKPQNVQEQKSNTQGQTTNEEPINLKVHFHGYDSYTLVDKNEKLLPVFKLAGEKVNVEVESVANPVSQNSVEEFQLQAIEKFPADIYGGTNIKNSLLSYAQQGAFIPLNDLIDQHAPNIKKFFEENPKEKAAMTAPDGKIYMINFMPDGTTGKAYFIRTDWLKKLGYDTPKTFDELEEVLYAFKNNDPNGNGVKDEIPYINERWQETIRLVNLWGARAYSSENFDDRVPVGQDGKLYHAWMTDAFKLGIENLNRWYEDGIIDPETFTRKVNTVKQLLWAKDDVGGMTHEWLASTTMFNNNEEILKRTPDFKVEAILPVAYQGKPFEEHRRSAVQPDGWAISASCKDPEVAIKFMDWFFTEEGRRAANFGIEGLTYTMVDGKPQYTDEVLSQGAVNIYLRTTVGAQLNLGYKQDYDYERQWTRPEGIDAYNLYANADIWSEGWTPMLNFTDEEMQRYDKVITSLNDYQNEKITAFITGKEDINTGWDAYIQQCKNLGAEDLVAVYQSAYDRYLTQN